MSIRRSPDTVPLIIGLSIFTVGVILFFLLLPCLCADHYKRYESGSIQ